MPRLKVVQKRCGVCGRMSDQHIFASTSMSLAPDLDMRPSPAHRWTMPRWIQTCPACGYCAPYIAQQLTQQRGRFAWSRRLYAMVYGSAPTIIASARYQTQRTSQAYPELANRFLCCAMLQARLGYIGPAAQSL